MGLNQFIKHNCGLTTSPTGLGSKTTMTTNQSVAHRSTAARMSGLARWSSPPGWATGWTRSPVRGTRIIDQKFSRTCRESNPGLPPTVQGTRKCLPIVDSIGAWYFCIVIPWVTTWKSCGICNLFYWNGSPPSRGRVLDVSFGRWFRTVPFDFFSVWDHPSQRVVSLTFKVFIARI